MKKQIITYSSVAAAILLGVFASFAQAGAIADMVCYCEIGTTPAGGKPWMYPDNVLVKDNNGISLGNWNDTTGLSSQIKILTGYDMDQGNPTGLVVGFSTAVLNGVGMDILIQGYGMAIEGSPYYWSEPGYVEVAMETTVPGQTGATVDGWADETFYLIKPFNYDIVGDPRNGPLSDIYIYGNDPSGAVDDHGDPIQVQYYKDSWGEDLIDAGGSQLDLYGYADWNPNGDRFDISDAIDSNGSSVSLVNIAYVRIRTVSNDLAGIYGSMSTEVCYVEDISVAPEPATLATLLVGGLLLRRRNRGA